MNQIRTFAFFLGLLFITSCSKDESPILNIDSQIVIQDSIFTSTLDINGREWDGAIIKNCTFKSTILSDGIRIANAENITIDNCNFVNIQGNGIRLHPSGRSKEVLIKNCSFDSIYGNGILASELHYNTKIIDNTFNWIGLDTVGSQNGAPHHGIYFQGDNYLIEANRISNIYNNDGNGISVRTSGVVRNNVVRNTTKNAITYFSDHPAISTTLVVENNILYNCTRGISIDSGGQNYVDISIIRFNTVITSDNSCISIGPDLSMNIDIYANILVRKDGSQYNIWTESSIDSNKNILSDSDIGFVDFDNHDYHILPSSIASSYATGISDYPKDDFEGDARPRSDLDAGADQN